MFAALVHTPPNISVHRNYSSKCIFQGYKLKNLVHACSVMPNSANPWTVACQAPRSMAFSKQEYWSGSPCSPPGDLPNPGMEPVSLSSPALTSRFFTLKGSIS